MNHNTAPTFADRARNVVSSIRTKAAAVGTGLTVIAGSAMAQPDTAAVITEITAAKTAGYVVLGAMILAGLGFAAWKLLKKAA